MNCSDSGTSVQETMDMLDHMQIQFKENFPVASQQEKQNIKTCLDSLICLSQQSSATKSCSQLEQQCVNDIRPQFPENAEIYFQTESSDDRVALLECKLQAMLCLVPGNTELEPQMCGREFEKCIEEAQQGKKEEKINNTITICFVAKYSYTTVIAFECVI